MSRPIPKIFCGCETWIGKLWPMSKCCPGCKGLTKKQICDSMWPEKPKIYIVWPFTEIVCTPGVKKKIVPNLFWDKTFFG